MNTMVLNIVSEFLSFRGKKIITAIASYARIWLAERWNMFSLKTIVDLARNVLYIAQYKVCVFVNQKFTIAGQRTHWETIKAVFLLRNYKSDPTNDHGMFPFRVFKFKVGLYDKSKVPFILKCETWTKVESPITLKRCFTFFNSGYLTIITAEYFRIIIV